MRLTRGAALVLAGALLAPVPVVAPPGAAPAWAAEGPDCAQLTADTVDEQGVRGDNDANLALHVPQAQQLARASGRGPGDGVTVVVVDSGIAGFAGTAPSSLESGHGIAVAGIVAGPDQPEPAVGVGIAPEARVVDAPFYGAPAGQAQEGVPVPMATSLAARLKLVGDAVRRGDYGGRVVVLVPTQVPGSADLTRQVARLAKAGVLLVAASGDRPAEGPYLDEYLGEPKRGEDAVDDVWPAADPSVLSVGVSAPGARGAVLRNSGIDLSAPGVGAVTKGLNGGWCVLAQPSTHWAAAQVAGVTALVWSARPADTAAQVRTRLLQTASGNGGPSSPVTGYGVVQPVEALQRRVEAPMEESEDVVARAKPPRERADLLAQTRRDAVWWGLGGGAVLAVLLLLRPLFTRRR